MEKVLSALKNLIKSESKPISVAIIEGEKKIVHCTENWDISGYLEEINSIWRSMEPKPITISGIEYKIIQITPERLIATTANKKGSLICFKDEERTIISNFIWSKKEFSGKLLKGKK